MPTYVHTARDIAILHERRICSVTFTVGVCIVNITSWWLADSSDFGLLGSKVSQNGKFAAQDAHEPPCKIDAARFILGGVVRNRKNIKLHTQTNKQ